MYSFIVEGKSVKCASGWSVRVYPYNEQHPTGPKRNHQDTLIYAQRAMTEDKTVSVYCIVIEASFRQYLLRGGG